MLDHGGSYRPLFELLAFTGLRIGEALGLTWADVDLDAGLLPRPSPIVALPEHAKLKTEAGRARSPGPGDGAAPAGACWLTSPVQGTR